MPSVHAGYKGSLYISGITNPIRFTDANISAKQTVETPDVAMGDFKRDLYYYGPVTINGSISGLVDSNNFNSTIFGLAFDRDTCGLLSNKKDFSLYYFCDSSSTAKKSQKFTNMYVNSLTFSCSAGEIATWQMDVIGKEVDDFASTDSTSFTTSSKLVTWDNIQIGISGGDMGSPGTILYQNVEFTINNNIEPIYAIKTSETLKPHELVPGLRTVTGALTIYDINNNFDGYNLYSDYTSTGYSSIVFTINGTTYTFKVRFHRIEPGANPGIISSTIGFTGVSI